MFAWNLVYFMCLSIPWPHLSTMYLIRCLSNLISTGSETRAAEGVVQETDQRVPRKTSHTSKYSATGSHDSSGAGPGLSWNGGCNWLLQLCVLKDLVLWSLTKLICVQGPNMTYPTPCPTDPEVAKEWRIYIAAKEKGIPAERPRG